VLTETGSPPTREGRVSHAHRRTRPRRPGRLLPVLWLVLAGVLLAGGLAAALTHFVDLAEPLGMRLPARTPKVGAGVVTVVMCGLLAHRVGGHTIAAVVFATGATGAALALGWPWLLAGVAALAAFTATVLGILGTRPAQRPVRIVVEYLVAIMVAMAGAVAVGAYAAPVKPAMLGDVVVLASVVATLWVARRLGGGFPGLGKRGALVVVFAVVVLAAGMVYGEALSRWGTPELIHSIDAARLATVQLIGAVPRPLELFIGFPALVWGLATRSKLRQGWWVCAFGALGTAGVATSLASAEAQLGQGMLSTAYSVGVGLLLGFLVWRVDRLLTGPRGKRARTAERAMPSRPEPGRSRPLL
jgi:hypothetical protein